MKKILNKTPHVYCIMAVVIAALCFYAACSNRQGSKDNRTDELKMALHAIDDSMKANSSVVPIMVKRGLRAAKDSLEYYDFYLRQLLYEASTDRPDTSSQRWAAVCRFLESQSPTPRINGMLGYLHNANAFFDQRYHPDNGRIIGHYVEACRRYAESDAKENLPDVYANLGDACMNANDMPRAAEAYRRALFLVDSLGLPKHYNVSLYLGLGRIYMNLNDFESARSCFQHIDNQMRLLPLNMQIYFLNSYGNYFYYTHDYNSALSIFERLEQLLRSRGMAESYDMYVCRLNMADVYLNLNRFDDAAKAVSEVEPFFRSVKFEPALYYCNTIKIGLAMGRADTAAVSRILASEHLSASVDFQLVNIRHRYLCDYYVRMGNYQMAYETLKNNIEHNDSMQHSITYMRTAEIMMRYTQDTLTLHHHIEMQEKDAHIRGTRTALYGFAMLVVILVLLLLWFMTYSRKRSADAHLQLMRMKLMSARSLISPHFIFNVLNNCITGSGENEREQLITLVKLIRTNLKMSGKFFVTLKEELDFVRYYVSIESRNVGGSFDFKVNAPADDVLEKILIPSMFVQILVENSLKHALKGCVGAKKLYIDVEHGDNCWKVSVTDNGSGFDIRRFNPDSTGTGLSVIRTSINMLNNLNNRKFKLSVHNLKDAEGLVVGCKISLTLPEGLNPKYDNQ